MYDEFKNKVERTIGKVSSNIETGTKKIVNFVSEKQEIVQQKIALTNAKKGLKSNFEALGRVIYFGATTIGEKRSKDDIIRDISVLQEKIKEIEEKLSENKTDDSYDKALFGFDTICSRCGADVDETDKFCRLCGKKL